MTDYQVDYNLPAGESVEDADKGWSTPMTRLIQKWRDDAVAMDEIADEDCNDGEEAKECIERAKTFRECASDLECLLAGRAAGAGGVGENATTKEATDNDPDQRPGESPKTL